MFYSQFILAKKGPLGTIWIAAHLERKLRKNQVADTDIGDSVDSILSPDVPIALRLSSHLLLGVVRIYSRKVNYLFDDCSEALLKIKQAFRSAAVDLPPEESKAPYHSITLPETFDLDDFELPDNDIFRSNFVDHHVSSREQITLQDPMEGVSYSTSKFGLDERFGDGDASGLDLDVELFLDKIGTDGHVNGSADPQASAVSMNPVKQDELPETSNVNSQIPVDLDDDTNLMDYAQAPCTPGLVDEPNLSNVLEVSACEDHLESECQLLESTETEKAKITGEDKQEVDWCYGNNKKSDATPSCGTADENSYRPDAMDINLVKQHEEFLVEADMEHVSVDESSPGSKHTPALIDKSLNPTSEVVDKITEVSDVSCTEGLQNGIENTDNTSSLPVDKPCDDYQGHHNVGFNEGACEIFGHTSTCEQVSEGLAANCHGSIGAEVPGGAETATNLEKLCCNSSSLNSENQHESFPPNPDTLAPHSSSLNNDAHENVASTGNQFLLPCKSNMQQLDSGCGRSTDAEIRSDDAVLATSRGEEMVVQGIACGITDNPEEILKGNQMQDIHAASGEPESESHDADPHETLVGNQDRSAKDELPAPEKLLSVQEGHVEQHCNMLLTESPGEFVGLDEGDAGSKNISGKKRSFTESTLTEQSLNSVESSRLVKLKQTVESVPDDDDLLSSILVGRSSVLKVKPTPRLSVATSGKRTRLAPRTNPKRKVLMDDTMVLHGDMIRKQLTSTEDIRRVRKKAPCTIPEISVIQKQHLEDEIFLEPTFTGVSSQLSSLHSLMWDLKRIIVCKTELDGGSLQIGVETVLPSEQDKNDSHEIMAQPSTISHDIKSDESPTAAEPHLTCQSAENGQSQDTKIENDPGAGELNVIEKSTMGITREASLEGDNEMAEHTENPLLSNSRLKEFSETSISKKQTEATNHVEADVSPLELLLDVDGVEKSHKDADIINSSVITGDKPLYYPGDTSGDMLETPAGLVQSGPVNETSEMNPSVEADTSSVRFEQKADVPSSELDPGVREMNNGQTINAHTEDGDINAAVETTTLRDDFLSGVVGDGGTTEMLSNVEHEHIAASLYPSDMGLGDDGFLTNVENLEHPETYQSYMMDLDSGFDLQDQEEWKYSTNDTDFLNVDDDELTEIADDHIPQDEEARFTENTGWSSRTRAVSKYLQTMFVKEANHGRKSLSMDNLLIGKSCKEASRMFFETLVLKTRDYIQVEQQNPFDGITIRPQMRLMKSEF